MMKVFGGIKNSAKRVALLASLFLAVFALLFYIVNLDLDPARKSTSSGVSVATNADPEIAKKLGSTTLGFESYADWAKRFGLSGANAGLDNDSDKDGLPNYLEYVHGTNPLKADSDGDGFSDKQEIVNGYDPDAPGDTKPTVEISIAKINVSAPMVWSKNELEKDMLTDLESGVAHFSKTAAPGQIGNMIISGHSSNYIWAKGNYNHIFKDLGNLEKGDTVIVKTTQKNGRVIAYNYRITDKFVTSADDERIFADATGPTLTLSTCWPIRTNLKRIILKGTLL